VNALFKTVAAVFTGAAAMYYFDPEMGRRRRALARDKAVALSHDARDYAQGKSRRIADRAKGLAATVGHRAVEPLSDYQLRDRIRSQLGRVASHPRAIEVDVIDGDVCLYGDVLAEDVQPVVSTVSSMTGVKAVDNQLRVHDEPGDIPALQGRRRVGRARRTLLPLLAMAAPVAMLFTRNERHGRRSHTAR
jgi:hypothetical protein